MEVDQARESDLLLLVRQAKPVRQVFENICVATIGIIETRSINEMNTATVQLKCENCNLGSLYCICQSIELLAASRTDLTLGRDRHQHLLLGSKAK